MTQTRPAPPFGNSGDIDPAALNEGFTPLISNDQDIRKLFRSVQTELDGSEQIDETVREKWKDLRVVSSTHQPEAAPWSFG